jgi:hypothetical protein
LRFSSAPGARVGTVDKFQGHAISRAKCISILVSSPQIFDAECRTPRQMQLANAFCRFLEMAQR